MVHCWGSRIGDTIAALHTEIIDGRWNFKEQKSGKIKSVRITTKANTIIKRYEGQSPYYLFPLLKVSPMDKKNYSFKKKIEARTSLVNRKLKIIAAELNIKKNLSTHVARHTFSGLMLNKGATISQLRDLLNHENVRTTEEYAKMLKRTDDLDEIGKI
jgi:integrase